MALEEFIESEKDMEEIRIISMILFSTVLRSVDLFSEENLSARRKYLYSKKENILYGTFKVYRSLGNRVYRTKMAKEINNCLNKS